MIRIDEALVGLGGLVALRLVVVDDELDLFTSHAGDFKAAARVHLLPPEGISLGLHGRRGGERSGLTYGVTNTDDVVLGVGGGRQCRRGRQSAIDRPSSYRR